MDVAALQSLVSSVTVGNISNNARVQSGTDTVAAQLTEAKDVYTSKLAEIAAKYDVKHMSANQVGDMAQELRDKGLISTPDFLSMSLLPHLMANGDAGAKAAMAADGTVDLIKYWNIKSVKPSDAESGLNLFDTLTSKRNDKTDGTASAVKVAASSYADAISKTTADSQSVVNVLNALASHKKDDTLTNDISSASYDIHNMSPRELANTTQRMAANGEISLKDQLLFSLVDREKSLSKLMGREVHVQAWSSVFDNPDKRRDMMVDYKAMLQGQSGATSDLTRDAIALLEKMSKKNSFGQLLANQTYRCLH